MKELFFEGHAAWFTWPAAIGALFFIMRMVLLLAGGLGDIDMDAGGGGGHLDLADGHASTDAFQVLSLQSLLAFAMGFGCAGLGIYKGSGVESIGVQLLVATAGGVAMVWLLGLLLKGMADLQSSGNISIQSTLGLEGTVYVTVPAKGGGRGQVRLVVEGNQRMYWAITEGERAPTGTRVKITRVNSDNTVTVAAV